MSTKIILLGCLLFSGLISCEKEIDTFTIRYIRSSGWVGYNYAITLDQHGTMHVKYNNGLVDTPSENYYQVSHTDITRLKDQLTILSSIDIDDQYGFGADKPTDFPMTFYSYNTNLNSDSTSIYCPTENELPDALDSFIKLINQIITETDTSFIKK
jgi:hypothetical protein